MKFMMVMLLAVMMPMFISCEQPDTPDTPETPNTPVTPETNETNEKLIIGTWECYKDIMKIWVGDNLVTDNTTTFEPGEYWWRFDTNGTITFFVKEDGEGDQITYRVEGDKLYREDFLEYSTDYYLIHKLTNTEMVIEWTSIEYIVNKYNEILYFTRVK